ncbi:hypothetical protein SPIROBIBN47_20041 [uncultured spirochete]|jgi:murein DD-endopeptidase MepM/ murein hydrolase activator NlpD|uniref:LysM domain-containing protein n=1 Tax=uncultured spirochete TaxID=156406 RepID=A0A3P3XH38_9SPIR|nr:hypothetical protein SPIROBIBN47_20041 [uncultured spirochete]HCX96327.1 hypothetical protein [Spirochaetaceae bacterium]
MNLQIQTDDAILEAEDILHKPLVSVMSGENFVVTTPAAPRYRSNKERPHYVPQNVPTSKTPKARAKNRIDFRTLFRLNEKKNHAPRSGKPQRNNNAGAINRFSVQPAMFPRTIVDVPSELGTGVPGADKHRPFELGLVRRRPVARSTMRTLLQGKMLHAFAKIRARWIIALALVLAAAGTGFLAASIISNSHPIISLPNENSAQDALIAMLEPEPSAVQNSDTALPPLPSLLVERSYTVRRGDTLQTIARQFGLREDTIISANSLNSKTQLQVGKTLKIPNMNGVYHTVKRNESLSTISRAYGIEMVRIVDANNIASSALRAGDRLFIPNAKLDSSVLRNFYGDTFIWPVRGPISSPFGYRTNPFSGERTYHAAIDIVVNRGTSVKATREGKVADTGYNAVFGNYVIIRHTDGYQSLYAHLDAILARKGARVNQGEVIGRSGNTGQSTGPHLHFSIFRNGQAVDPRKYVK